MVTFLYINSILTTNEINKLKGTENWDLAPNMGWLFNALDMEIQNMIRVFIYISKLHTS